MQKLWRNRQSRNIALQAIALGFVMMILGFAAYNAASNLHSSGITSGFDFLSEKAGYDISFSLLEYSPKDATHAYAWLVGTSNTIFFSILTITTTTFVGLVVALMRLSPNWLLSALARAYVEYTRNIPVLVHIFIWYAIVLSLPTVRQSINMFDVVFLSNRGLYVPGLDWGYGTFATIGVLAACGAIAYGIWTRIHGGKLKRLGLIAAAIIAVMAICGLIFGAPFSLNIPVRRGFGFTGGAVLAPELIVMCAAVTVYFSAHCAEVIRGAIIAVPKGQAEAAMALGAKRRLVMMEVVIPQALRAIVPPMTSNYINILKAAALGTAIGFLDVMGTTGGSSLNITGQAIECIMIVMLTYMVLNLCLSAIMGRVNKAVQIKER